MTNIDARIPNPDQRLTQDIDKWAHSLSNLYSNVSKPILDIVLFSKKLATLLVKTPSRTINVIISRVGKVQDTSFYGISSLLVLSELFPLLSESSLPLNNNWKVHIVLATPIWSTTAKKSPSTEAKTGKRLDLMLLSRI